MPEPHRYPGRIRTDTTNAFAHHTMAVRVPAILRGVLARNPDYAPELARGVEALAQALERDAPLPPLDGERADAGEFRAALARRVGERWLATDWFFAETYAYRQLVERVRYWDTGRDPFAPNKREEYASTAHGEAFERALAVTGAHDERLLQLFGAALFGNRIDLSFAASREHGLAASHDDLLVEERAGAARALFDGQGALHVVADNAGTELTLDLVLVDFALHELSLPVVLHLKAHPTFVSDATERDVGAFLALEYGGVTSAAQRACVTRLAAAVRAGHLVLAPHAYWNGPASLWELPPELERDLSSARLVVLKGDANYRRAVGDAVWPADESFGEVTAYFPAPLLALRTLKSDPIVGLAPGRASELDALDATWRVNGKRGVASFGGVRHT